MSSSLNASLLLHTLLRLEPSYPKIHSIPQKIIQPNNYFDYYKKSNNDVNDGGEEEG